MNRSMHNHGRSGIRSGILLLLTAAVLAKWMTSRKIRELDGLGVVYKG